MDEQARMIEKEKVCTVETCTNNCRNLTSMQAYVKCMPMGPLLILRPHGFLYTMAQRLKEKQKHGCPSYLH